MARTYKTGPARSRRRPDPSTLARSGSVIFPVTVNPASGAPGELDVSLQPVDPTTGATAAIPGWSATGVPSRAYFVDSASVRHPLVIDVVLDLGVVVFQTLTGLPSGIGQVIVPGLDQAYRNENGYWLGSGIASQAVT